MSSGVNPCHQKNSSMTFTYCETPQMSYQWSMLNPPGNRGSVCMKTRVSLRASGLASKNRARAMASLSKPFRRVSLLAATLPMTKQSSGHGSALPETRGTDMSCRCLRLATLSSEGVNTSVSTPWGM